MKKITITSLALMVALSIMATSAYARNLQKNRPTERLIAPAAAGADHTDRNNLRYRFSRTGPSRQFYGHYNTNKYRYARRKVWNPQKHRPTEPSLRSFANNGNLTGHHKFRHLRPQQRPVRHVYGHQDTNRFRNGHWQVKKVWVPPKRNRVWKPGYSNSIGHWVPGKWITTKSGKGYWAEKQEWISPK